MNALKHAALLGLGEALTSFLFLFPFIFGMPDGYHVEIFSFASALTLASGMFYSLIIMFIFLIFFGRMKEKPKGEEDIYQ